MKMDKVAGSGNDEFYTPRYAVEPILTYLREGSKVWCPFDTERSLFVSMLREAGHEVVNTHLGTGHDFFKICEEYPDWVKQFDVIVSNPPYSIKTQVFETLFKTGKPFAMLVGVVGLFESQKRFEMFRDNPTEVMYLNRRVAYYKDYDTMDEGGKAELNPPFSSVYLCSKLLGAQMVFEEISKNGR